MLLTSDASFCIFPPSLPTGETGGEMQREVRYFKENAGVLRFENNIII